MDNQIVSFSLREWDRLLNDSRIAISKSSFELKQKWRNEVSSTLKDIVESNDPFRKLRDCLSNAVVTTSYYHVLMQHLRDDHGTPLSSISHPKLSWRLSEHILEITQKDKKLRRFLVAHGENVKELLDHVRHNYETNYAHLSAINSARTMMNDIGDDEDWLPQFYISMCIWQEDMVRKRTGIPSLFNIRGKSDNSDSSKYWTFKKFVRSGNKFPHREWQHLYGIELAEASFGLQRSPSPQSK